MRYADFLLSEGLTALVNAEQCCTSIKYDLVKFHVNRAANASYGLVIFSGLTN